MNDIKKTIWLTRPDLRKMFADDRERFDWWLLLNGAQEYNSLHEFELNFPHELLTEPSPEALPQVRPMMTRFMKLVWSLRPDLQQTFTLDTLTGQRGFVLWFFIKGVSELRLERFITGQQIRELNEPAGNFAPISGLLPLTRIMADLWDSRSDLQEAFDLNAFEGRSGFLVWYFIRGMVEYSLLPIVDKEQRRLLLAPSKEYHNLPCIMFLIWKAEGELQARFPDPSDADFQRWIHDEGPRNYPVLRILENQQDTKAGTVTRRRTSSKPFGVNLIGNARGQFGIGEDVRMAALAMQAAGIPFVIHNVEPGKEVCQDDESAACFLNDNLPYAVNLFCTTGIETARLAAVEGSRLFDGRRSIGYWPWELPHWPEQWHHAYNLVDEVWASTRFAYECYGRSCPKLVRHMPMAVTVDATAGRGRSDFGLPEDHFLFVFSFDVLSSVMRKNPQACVEAFRRAFPRGREPVGLVVKAMRAVPGNLLWRKLTAAAKADGRITVITNTLPRPKLLDLYRACDCYVSLHRSEGFGRGMAEAMLLGKPVIATGHSGNMDFTLPGTAALVDHRPRLVEQGDYPFGEGQVWAEPDVDHAAWWMRRIAGDESLRSRFAAAGRQLCAATYAPEVVGERYLDCLTSMLLAPRPRSLQKHSSPPRT